MIRIWKFLGACLLLAASGVLAEQDPSSAAPQMEIPKFHYMQMRDGRRIFNIIAEKGEFFQNEDLVLTGVQEITLFGADGHDSKLRAKFGRWNKKSSEFELWGDVVGQVDLGSNELGQSLTFETEKLVYRDAFKAVVTMRPVLLKTENFQTRGWGLNYNVVTQDLILGTGSSKERRVLSSMELVNSQFPGTLEIRADRMALNPKTKIARYEGQPVLEFGKSRLAGQKMTFYLEENESRLEIDGDVTGSLSVEKLAEGKIPGLSTKDAGTSAPLELVADKAVFHKASRTATLSGSVLVLRKDEKLSCDKLLLLMSDHGQGLQSVLAEGSVELIRSLGSAHGGRLIYRYDTDEGLITISPRIRLPQGELTAELIQFRRDGSLLAEHRVFLHYVPGPGQREPAASHSVLELGEGQPIDIHSEQLDYSRKAGVAIFREQVRIRRQNSWMEAELVNFNLDPLGQFKSLHGENAVRLVTEGRILSGDQLDYEVSSKKLYLQGAPAMARTGDDTVTARKMSFLGESQEYSAQEEVLLKMRSASLQASQKPNRPKNGVLGASCGRAFFSSAGAHVQLLDGVELTQEEEKLKLRSTTLDLFLSEDRSVSEMVARGDVLIDYRDGKAKGDVAHYRAAGRQLVIEGNPAQIEQPGRTSQPSRAVLYLDSSRVDLDGQISGRVRTVLQIEPTPR